MARGWKMKNIIQQKLQEVMGEETPVSPEEEERRAKEIAAARARTFDDDIIITPEMLAEAEGRSRGMSHDEQMQAQFESMFAEDHNSFVRAVAQRIEEQKNEPQMNVDNAPPVQQNNMTVREKEEQEYLMQRQQELEEMQKLAIEQQEAWLRSDNGVPDYESDPNFQEWMQAQKDTPYDIDESSIPPEPDEEAYYSNLPPDDWQPAPTASAPVPPVPPDNNNPPIYGTQGEMQMPPDESKPNKNPPSTPKPFNFNKKPVDDDIMIDADMLEEKPTRQLYTVKEEFLKETLDKIFARLDLPAIKYINGSDVLIETGGDAPADLILVKPDGGELKVPLGEHEQNKLDDSVAEFEQSKGLDKG